MLILIIVLCLILCLGGGYYGNRSYPGMGAGFGIAPVLVILLVIYLLGGFASLRL